MPDREGNPFKTACILIFCVLFFVSATYIGCRIKRSVAYNVNYKGRVGEQIDERLRPLEDRIHALEKRIKQLKKSDE